MLFYSVIPFTVLFVVWLPATKWLVTRGTVFAEIVDVVVLARNIVLFAPLVGIIVGTSWWCMLLGVRPEDRSSKLEGVTNG